MTSPAHHPYEIRFERGARRELTQLSEAAYAAVIELVHAIADNPHRLGSVLKRPPLQATYRAKRGEYRVLYVIDEDAHAVLISAVRHRRDAYRS